MLADFSVGVQTAARAPIFHFFAGVRKLPERGDLADGQGCTKRRTPVNRQEHFINQL